MGVALLCFRWSIQLAGRNRTAVLVATVESLIVLRVHAGSGVGLRGEVLGLAVDVAVRGCGRVLGGMWVVIVVRGRGAVQAWIGDGAFAIPAQEQVDQVLLLVLVLEGEGRVLGLRERQRRLCCAVGGSLEAEGVVGICGGGSIRLRRGLANNPPLASDCTEGSGGSNGFNMRRWWRY